MRISRYFAALVSVCALSLLVGCEKPEAPEDQVSRKAKERWQALIEQDFTKAYGYLSPAYRGAVSTEAYKGQFGGLVEWKKAGINSVDCTDQACDVVVRLDYRYVRAGAEYEASRILDEKWIEVEGEWWYFQKK